MTLEILFRFYVSLHTCGWRDSAPEFVVAKRAEIGDYEKSNLPIAVKFSQAVQSPLGIN
ncbi:hypothetical protein DSM3645_14720 [Blastopirellula marina DSM 3645]|uniref:Uncharacterized protein n=1 Tax=Blastopirellula marina DSM 3645 TaxID=314230 RepID=A3ZSE8_9BACT|nr:hypothetical protein DSM3645_14720 [Blastopirellula marina DSM 3645]